MTERRAELALLRAVGYRRGALVAMATMENALLLAVGLAAGGLSALAAAVPVMAARAAMPPWGTLAAVLGGVFLLGAAAAALAAWAALRTPLLPALKGE
jgi:putative ABC transport system permease protein